MLSIYFFLYVLSIFIFVFIFIFIRIFIFVFIFNFNFIFIFIFTFQQIIIQDKIQGHQFKDRIIVSPSHSHSQSIPVWSQNQTNTSTSVCENNSILQGRTSGCLSNLKIFGWTSYAFLYNEENRGTYTVRFILFYVIIHFLLP